MPTLNNGLLDDPLIFDGDASFGGGQVSFYKPSTLQPSQASELVNVDINSTGRHVTRLGTSKLGTHPDSSHVRGLFYYDWTSDYLMRVSNGVLRRWDGSNWATVSGFTPGTSFNVEMCQLQGNLYLTNGANVYYWNGSGAAAVVADADAPACRFLVTHAGRVFALGLSAKDNIQWSSVLSASGASDWDPASTFSVGGGDSEGVTGAVSWQDYRLLVFKRNSIYAVNADPTVIPSSSTWSVDTISRRIGCVSHRSIQQVGNDVFFLSDDGVRSLGRTLSDQQVGVSEPVSEPINDIIGRINWAFIETCSSAYYRSRYILSVPVDSATTPNYVLVFNKLTNSWSGYWTNWNATAFAVTSFGGVSKLVFGEGSGGTFEWLGWKAESVATAADYFDDGEGYPTTIVTRGYAFQDPVSPKTGYSYEIEFYNSSASVTASLVLDRSSPSSAFTGPTQKNVLVLPLELPFLLPAKGSFRSIGDAGRFGQFYSAQVKLESGEGKLAVQGIILSGFLDTIRHE